MATLIAMILNCCNRSGSPSDSIPDGVGTDPTVAALIITTSHANSALIDKKKYTDATLSIDSCSSNILSATPIKIRGRGNSSWSMPKKPYRIKFDKKTSLCGLPASKNYVLLANWTDASLMKMALACEVGRLLQLDYTPKVKPVELIIDGQYQGAYLLTNQPGIRSGSVDIDPDSATMLELDVNHDASLKFRSDLWQLPVDVKHPSDASADRFAQIRDDFNAMEKAIDQAYSTITDQGIISPEAEIEISRLIDLDNFARYAMVHIVVRNDEMARPKSCKIYRSANDPYRFGPIWDFDCSMGYNWDTSTPFDIRLASDSAIIDRNNLTGRLFDFPTTIAAMTAASDTLAAHRDELLLFIDQYSQAIGPSARRNQARWPELPQWDGLTSMMKQWLTTRLNFLQTVDWQSDL